METMIFNSTTYAANVAEAVERTAEAINAPTPEYQNPFATPKDPSVFDSLGAAFKLTNTEVNAYQAVRRSYEEDFEVDPDFDPYEFTQANKNDPRVQAAYPLLLGPDGNRLATLTSEARYWDAITKLNREQHETEVMGHNGALTALAGGVLGNVLSPSTWLVPGATLKALKGATALRGGKTLVGAAAGLADAGVNAVALAGNQDLFTEQDAFLNLSIGAVLGGIGGQFISTPVRVPYDRPTPMQELRPGQTVGDALDEHHRASLSSAASPDNKPAANARLGVLDALSPVGRAIRRSSMADADFAIHQKLYEIPVTTLDNERGLATGASAERIAEITRDTLFLTRAEKIGAVYNKMALEAFGEGAISRNAKNFAGLTSDRLTAEQFYEQVTAYRRARQVIEDEGDGASLAARELVSEPHSNPKVSSAIKEAAEVEDGFYTAYADLLQKHGLLTVEERRKFYVPAVVNRRAVLANEAEFRDLLRDHLMANPSADWLEQVYGVRDIKQLGEADREIARGDWVHFQHQSLEASAQRQLDDAMSKLGSTKTEMAELRKQGARAERDFVGAKVREARAKEAELQAEWQTLREEAQQRRAEYDALQRAYDAGIANANARARQLVDVQPDAGLGRSLEDFMAGKPVEAPKAPSPSKTPEMASAKARLEDANKRLREVDARVANTEARLKQYQATREEAEARLGKIADLRSSVRKALVEKRKDLKAAKGAARIAERKVASVGKVLTIEEKVDQIVDAIARGKQAPHGILRETVGESGRLKELELFKGNILMDPRVKPFLVHDAEVLAERYGHEIAPRVAFREAFGPDVDDSLTGPIRELRNSWTDRINVAKSDVEKQRLTKAMKESLRDFQAVRDKLLGVYGIPDDPDHALMFLNRTARNLNVPISLGMALMSSLTDVATGILATSKTFAWVPKLGRSASKTAEQMTDRELAALMLGTEQSRYVNRQTKGLFIEDPMRDAAGIGTGTTEKVTGAVDRGLAFLARNTNVLNGVQAWSAKMRFVFGTVQVDNMVRELGRWSELTPKQRAQWARLGIDDALAARIAKQLTDHGEKVNGVRLPNGRAWDDAEAYRAFQIALTRAMDESVIRVGAGDLPLFMSRPAGKLMGQFLSFAFAATNKYTRLAWQKRDLDTLMSVTFGLALGTLGYVAREALKGTNDKGETASQRLAKLGPGDWAYAAFTRSPLPGVLANGMDAAMKLGRGPLNYLTGTELFNVPTKMQDRGALTHLLGPSFGLLERFEGLMSAVANAPEKGLQPVKVKAWNMTPWLNLLPMLAVTRAADAAIYGED